MAFDGIVIANLAHDIKSRLEGGKINKIAQPENGRAVIYHKNNRETYPSVYLSQLPVCPSFILQIPISPAP